MKTIEENEQKHSYMLSSGRSDSYSETLLKRQLSKVFPAKFEHLSFVSSTIADFYCEKAKLIIELESKVPDWTGESFLSDDRCKELKSKGFSIIKVSNYDIFNNIKGVMNNIEHEMKLKLG
ncbi:MAG TPA: DUF559 domain-containing protein [Paludibacteraceae bacterium]|nr:DUF559 domain-containing protein [Paludibacteraceae bacterium]